MKLMQQPLIKPDGNKQQFQHELSALGKMEEALNALDQRKYDKAKEALSEGIERCPDRAATSSTGSNPYKFNSQR